MKHLVRFVIICLLMTLPFSAAQAGKPFEYKDGDTQLEGYWAVSTCDKPGKKPVVLIVHQWMGLGNYEKSRADMLADQCYNAIAIDMYGKGVRPKDQEEAGKMAGLYKGDFALARKRLKAALDYVLSTDGIDNTRVAILGYCFGGTMALELARSGADIDGAVSFHGGLATKAPVQENAVKASVQIHHGADDPLVPPEEVKAFVEEMNAANADWSMTHYAHAVHSFTQKDAGSDPSKGVAYNEKADKRSWQSMLDFLKEIFG
jgi:dienelactone hydrolase